MAVTSPATTTTCVTCPRCSALTWERRWCSSPQMELGSATSSVAQYKVSTPLLTLGQVGVRWLDSVLQFTANIDSGSKGSVMCCYVKLRLYCKSHLLRYFTYEVPYFNIL